MGMIMHDDEPYGEGTSYTQGTGIAINNNIIAVDADNTPTKNSEKPVKSKGVYSALESNRDESTSLLKSTVGWTGKNLLKNEATSQTINGVTFTVNGDGSVTANGTSREIAYLTLTKHLDTSSLAGCLINGLPIENTSDIEYRIHSQSSYVSLKDFVKNNDVLTDVGNDVCFSIRIARDKTVNNLTFYPMLRDASITDDTYEPYHESVETMYEEEIHGVNLLKNEATTQTIYGVTFTVNADGSVTVNGTATGEDATLTISEGIKPSFNGLVLNGCPSGGGIRKYLIGYSKRTSPFTPYGLDFGNGVIISIPSGHENDDYFIYIRIKSGVTVNNLVFKPMIRKAEIEDSTYRPYNEQAIQNQLNAQGVLGAKNLLPYPYVDTTKTINGMTYTDNGDGSVTANASTATTSASSFIFKRFNENTLPKGKYIITDEGGSITNTYLAINKENASGVYVADLLRLYPDKHKAEFTVDYNGYEMISIMIYTRANVTANNLTFKPMLRLASDPDDTYIPYAMTNRELTEEIANIVTDDWTTTSQVQSDGTVTFSGLNDSYGYKIYYTLPSGDSAYTFSKVTKSGSGTSVTLTYTTDAPSGTVCKLRILK